MVLFRKTMKPVERVLKDANVKKEDVNEVRFLFVIDIFAHESLCSKRATAS